MADDVDRRARELLHGMLGLQAEFRPGQLEAIRALYGESGRVLVVQRTGWGKSAVYLIATRLLREDGRGPTLLVSPLLALMRNQIDMARRIGVRAATINSANREDWDAIAEEIAHDAVDILLISPERLNNAEFRANVLPDVLKTTGLLVVDEAHCISDWGHDFRPDYRRIVRVIDLLPDGVPVLCTTATANDRVVDDVVAQLGTNITVLRGTLDRESLVLAVAPQHHPAERMAWLVEHLKQLQGTGIVYCLTITDTVRVADWLESNGISAHAYSGDTDPAIRERVEQDLLDNRVKVVVATSALGMGFDKPDLGFVVHFQSPGSAIAYYQQVGRAGRALERSDGILLQGGEDEQIQDYFIKIAFPRKDQAEHVIALLDQAGDAVRTTNALLAEVNVRKTRLEAMLKVLEVEGAVERANRGWRRTTEPWSYDEERVERVTAARRREQQAMRDYGTTRGCLMQFLREQLDDPDAKPCGRCMNCTATPLELRPSKELVAKAEAFLRSRELIIEPRRMWPPSFPAGTGRIPQELQSEPGRALCVESDGGWGALVRAGREADAFSQELVSASARAIRRWNPNPFPTWATCVPSLAKRDLVPAFAAKLAQALGIEFHPIVAKLKPTRPQREMENSAQQLANVLDAFELRGQVPDGPVLLIDDLADSRWTLTVVATKLREAGAGPIHPFVLAEAAST